MKWSDMVVTPTSWTCGKGVKCRKLNKVLGETSKWSGTKDANAITTAM